MREGVTKIAYDAACLIFTGTAASQFTVMSGASGATFLGAGQDIHGGTASDIVREFRASLLVSAATGADTAWANAIKFQDAATNETTAWSDLGYAFSSINTTNAPMRQTPNATTAANYPPPSIDVRTRPGRRWVRVFATITATTPTFTLAVVGMPISSPPA
jgi:hypothetical protein